ncbi:hypothetical protein ABRP55_13770 [Pectobacterium zantedeschiae]|uniref:virion core protein, T7 gp14 family n=1 Tax=Pectobacterium zantedeschiae TaxID=2034769 RepID=UPI0032EBAF5B
MCGPVAVGVAVLAASAMQAYSQNQSAKATAKAANTNAEIAEGQAKDAINRGNANADRVRQQYRQQAGAQAAAMGASGSELSSGTALDIFGDTAAIGELDAMTTFNNAEREAYGFRAQGSSFRNDASVARLQGKNAVASTIMTAPLKAYGAYSMAGGTWSPFSNASTFNNVSGNINSFYGS